MRIKNNKVELVEEYLNKLLMQMLPRGGEKYQRKHWENISTISSKVENGMKDCRIAGINDLETKLRWLFFRSFKIKRFITVILNDTNKY